jgi:hypothetical protein
MHEIFAKSRLQLPAAALLAFTLAAGLRAQNFSSGSNGQDGDLIVNNPGVVTTFTQTPFGGGTVYNFKSIQIYSGSTLKISGANFASPLYFLAQGAVTIAGTLDLSGQFGSDPSTATQRTQGMTVPGPGGYAGGAAGYGSVPAQPGLGPLGGVTSNGCTGQSQAGNGGFGGNAFLVPLVGGSGGGGYSTYGSGGAGGGALLIASSLSITINGAINANGGNGANGGGGGAGGGIRLVAPSIMGGGSIYAYGGQSYCLGTPGVIRMEAYQNTYAVGNAGPELYTAAPSNLFLPAANSVPTITVASIGGVAITTYTGSFVVPDVLLNSASPLTVVIQANNIPAGTIPTVYFLTENFPDQKIAAAPLTAVAGSSTATTTTATVTLNPGYSVGFVTATWKQ